jgi:hypothetical protein
LTKLDLPSADGPEPAPSPEADLTTALLPEATKPTIVFL